MAIRYVGGEPTRITCYTKRKNTDRWMHEPKPRLYLPNWWLVCLVIIGIAVFAMLIWFVTMCLK